MTETGKLLRAAAVLYALDAVIASASFTLDPGTLAHTAATAGLATRLLAAEPMIRISMLTEAVYQTVEVFLAIQLYRLFKPVSSGLSQQMLAFALIPIPIMFLNLLTEIAALMFAGRSAMFTVFTAQQRDLIVGLLIDLHGQGLNVASVFWGLWLLPLGLLIIRSGFVPKPLGICCVLGGIGWVLGSASSLILPGLVSIAATQACSKAAMILEIGELPFIGWLVVWGVRMGFVA